MDEHYAYACFILEKKANQNITPEYPAAKFMVALEMMKKYYKKQEEEMNRTSRGKRFR